MNLPRNLTPKYNSMLFQIGLHVAEENVIGDACTHKMRREIYIRRTPITPDDMY